MKKKEREVERENNLNEGRRRGISGKERRNREEKDNRYKKMRSRGNRNALIKTN